MKRKFWLAAAGAALLLALCLTACAPANEETTASSQTEPEAAGTVYLYGEEHANEKMIEQELEHMPSTENFQTVADVFKQLSDGSRIRIFWLLCHCEECVINLSAMLEMSSPAVSHHLRLLKNSGLVVSRRDGKEVYYRAADTEQSQLLHKTIEKVIEISCQD